MPQETAQDYAWIKFEPKQLSDKIVPEGDLVEKLIKVCGKLSDYDLLSSYPEGAVYKGKPVKGSNGNISCRYPAHGPDSVLTTQTQLLSKKNLEPKDLVVVEGWNLDTGEVFYHGPKAPTSEFWLHEGLYAELDDITWVLHFHAPTKELYSPCPRRLWKELNILETKYYAEDGTLDVPKSVLDVLDFPFDDYVIMYAHGTPWDPEHTGAVVVDNNPDRAVERIINIHERLKEALKSR